LRILTAAPAMPSLNEADIGKLLKGIDIPPCPAVLSALLAEMKRDDANIARISRLITQDVALAAGIMKIANSAFFQPARQVGSITEALGFLGFGQVFNLLVKEVLQKSIDDQADLRIDRYWDSAAWCAVACANLALALPGTTRDNAYCFGLFHDCGIPVLMRRFPDYRETLKLANADDRRHFTKTEEARHGTHHAVIGHLISRTWGLAPAVSQAILSHHDLSLFEDRQGVDTETLTLIAINLIAEHLVGLYLRDVSEGEWERARPLVADFFGLSPAKLNDLVDDMLVRIEMRKAA
jgi:HD-like signal output (HDOD) protein